MPLLLGLGMVLAAGPAPDAFELLAHRYEERELGLAFAGRGRWSVGSVERVHSRGAGRDRGRRDGAPVVASGLIGSL